MKDGFLECAFPIPLCTSPRPHVKLQNDSFDDAAGCFGSVRQYPEFEPVWLL